MTRPNEHAPPPDSAVAEALIMQVGRGEYRLEENDIRRMSWAGCAAIRSAIADVVKCDTSAVGAYQRLREDLRMTASQIRELVDGLNDVFGIVIVDAGDESVTIWDCYDQADRQLTEPHIRSLIDAAEENVSAHREIKQSLSLGQRAERLERLAADDESELLARALYCQGTCLLLMEEPREALECFEESLRIRKRILGERNLTVPSAMHNIAVALERQNRADEAEAYYRQAIAICDAELGPDFGDTQLIVKNLGSLLVRQGRLDEGEQLLRRALEVSQRHFGREHRQTATMIAGVANVLVERGDLAQAETLLRESLQLCSRLIGRESTQATAIGNNLAVVLSRRGRNDEALVLAENAVGISARQLGMDHPTTIAIRNNLAVIREELDTGAGEQEWEDLVAIIADWPANDPIREAVVHRRFVALPVAA